MKTTTREVSGDVFGTVECWLIAGIMAALAIAAIPGFNWGGGL